MSKALVKTGSGSGFVPGAASFLIPGVGQLINGETDKGIGVFAVSVLTGLAFLTHMPLVGGICALVHIGTRIYAAGDAYVQGKKR